jgi:homoserine kinase
VSKSGIKVSAPATVSNIAGGLNNLGLALETPADEIIIREGNQPGLVITEIQGAAKRLSSNISVNPAGIAAYRLLEHLGETQRPIELEIHKKIALDSGLGSSAALTAAGVYGVNEYLRTGMSRNELLPFTLPAYKAEEAYDTAAHILPSLMGGMILVTDEKELTFKKMYIPAGLHIAVLYPHIQPDNRKWAQMICNKNITFQESLDLSQHLAAFVAAMYTSDMDLMRSTLHKVQPHEEIATLIPEFHTIRDMAFRNGATGFGIAGAGPSMFVLCTDSGAAKNIIEEAGNHFKIIKKGISAYYSRINHEGAIVY